MSFSGIINRLDNLIVGRTRCYVGLIIAMIDNFFFGAIHYGFSTLIPVYVKMKVLNHLCEPGQADCLAQYKAYGNASIFWTLVMRISVMPNGFLLDKVSIKLSKAINVFCSLLGALLQAFISEERSNIYYVGGIFTATGSMSSLMTSITISNFFPNNPSFAIGLVGGAWDSSTAVLPIFAKSYQSGVSLQTSYLILGAFGLVSGTFLTLFIYSNKQSDMIAHGKAGNNSDKMEKIDPTEDVVEIEETSEEAEQIDPQAKLTMCIDEFKLHRYPTLKRAIFSGPYLLNLVFYVIGYFRFSCFFALIANTVEKKMPEFKNELLTNLSYFLISGILFSPFTGLFYDKWAKVLKQRLIRMMRKDPGDPNLNAKLYYNSIMACFPGICVIITATIIYSGCIFSLTKTGIYLSFFFLFFKREFFFLNNSVFMRTTFRKEHFGTLYGISNMSAGIFSLINIGLQEMKPDSGNGVAIALTSLLFALPTYLLIETRGSSLKV